jgi:long-chain fatty acid transport protein
MLRISGSPVNYPYYPLYNDISRNFFFSMGAGFEPWDGWAVGLNVRSTTRSTALYTLRADNTVNYSASAVEAKGESRISVNVLYDHERSRPGEGREPFTVGAMYRAKAGLTTKLAADVTAFVPVQGELNSLPAFSPAEWVLMGTWRRDRWIFSFDGAWVKWSAFASPYGTGNINTYVIGANPAAEFKDVFVPRLGVERTSPQDGRWLKRIAYRLGYLWHPSPVPDQTGDSNFADNDRHSFTSGLGFGFRNPWRDESLVDLDLFFQYNHLRERVTTKVSAANVGAPGYRSGGSILLYGAGLSLRF